MKMDWNIFLTAKERRERKRTRPLSLRSLRSFAVSILLCSSAVAEEFPGIGTFNAACELYRAKDFLGSEKMFGSVAAQTEDDDLKANALYNQGTALLAGTVDGSISNRLDAVAQAITLFEKTLELAPEDMDAKQNLERALHWMAGSRIKRTEKLLDEADALLNQDQARQAKENCETAKETLSPVAEDFDPDSPKVQPLMERADRILKKLERAIELTKEDLKNARHAIDLYEYRAAADVMLADKPERKWAFDLDEELAKEFQQMIRNNQNIITIVYPQNQQPPLTP